MPKRLYLVTFLLNTDGNERTNFNYGVWATDADAAEQLALPNFLTELREAYDGDATDQSWTTETGLLTVLNYD